MGVANTASLWARWFGVRTALRKPEPADLGTAFGMEASLSTTEEEWRAILDEAARQPPSHWPWWSPGKR